MNGDEKQALEQIRAEVREIKEAIKGDMTDKPGLVGRVRKLEFNQKVIMIVIGGIIMFLLGAGIDSISSFITAL